MPRSFNSNEKLKATRDRLMKYDQVLGMSIAELSAKYRLHPNEVKEALSDAQKSGVLELIEKGVFETLMPKALAVLERHLDEGNSLKAVELTLAVFGVVKTSVKAKNSFEIQFPESTRGVGIVALDQIRQERLLPSAQKRERHDVGPEIDDPSGETLDRELPGKRREH
jgi:hypothetical protein